ncbi:MAG: hypothetical protein RL497_836 [Pseudomonadota bacterium]|jgi:folate-binding protein YgfZ
MMQTNQSENELHTDKIYNLSDYHFIEVSGPDAASFVQSQVTCDIRRLEQHNWLLGAQCNPKGRMVLSFVAFQGLNGIILRVHKSLTQAFDGLKKYAVFTKVKLALQEIPVRAVISKNIVERFLLELNLIEPLSVGKCLVLEEAIVLARADDWLEIYGVHSGINAWVNGAIATGALELANDFDAELIRRGIAEVRSETFEEYIPQMFNFDHVDAISFKKGCYTGQEIVARMQYLGKLKKHLYRGEITGITLPVGTPLYGAEYNEAQGEVVLSCGDEFLAVVNDQAVANHPLFSSLDERRKIQWLALPYAITM